MSNDALKEHYERKYASESTTELIESVRATAIPTNRFEAALRFFPRYFRSGDVLEIGAGSGNVAKALLGAGLDIRSYTLSDLSETRIGGVRRNLNDPRVRAVELDAERMPESEHGKYDAVIMIALIEHLIDPLRAMQGVRRALKPGGFVYVDTPNIARYTQRIKLALGRFPSTASKNEGLTTYSGERVDLYDEGHLHYFTFRSLSSMLTERCGFSRVVKLGYPGGLTPLGKHVHNVLAKVRPELFSELALIAYA